MELLTLTSGLVIVTNNSIDIFKKEEVRLNPEEWRVSSMEPATWATAVATKRRKMRFCFLEEQIERETKKQNKTQRIYNGWRNRSGSLIPNYCYGAQVLAAELPVMIYMSPLNWNFLRE